MRLEYLCPARGLIGYRSQFLTDTRGTGILNHNFKNYGPFAGAINARGRTACSSRRTTARPTPTASSTCRSAGSSSSGRVKVYGGQIVGLHSRDNDLVVNPSKAKKLTNIRTTAADEKLFLTTPRPFTLEAALEFINDDELVEVTPAPPPAQALPRSQRAQAPGKSPRRGYPGRLEPPQAPAQAPFRPGLGPAGRRRQFTWLLLRRRAQRFTLNGDAYRRARRGVQLVPPHRRRRRDGGAHPCARPRQGDGAARRLDLAQGGHRARGVPARARRAAGAAPDRRPPQGRRAGGGGDQRRARGTERRRVRARGPRRVGHRHPGHPRRRGGAPHLPRRARVARPRQAAGGAVRSGRRFAGDRAGRRAGALLHRRRSSWASSASPRAAPLRSAHRPRARAPRRAGAHGARSGHLARARHGLRRRGLHLGDGVGAGRPLARRGRAGGRVDDRRRRSGRRWSRSWGR